MKFIYFYIPTKYSNNKCEKELMSESRCGYINIYYMWYYIYNIYIFTFVFSKFIENVLIYTIL